jgi:DNA-binding PadR family transcriptional regulator
VKASIRAATRSAGRVVTFAHEGAYGHPDHIAGPPPYDCLADAVHAVYRRMVYNVDPAGGMQSDMATNAFLGEFEQMVLLAILQCRDQANGLEIRRELEESAGRRVSKGAFYTTLDRLESKGYLTWETREPEQGPSKLPQRHFTVTPSGLDELRRSREALQNLWRGLDDVMQAT